MHSKSRDEAKGLTRVLGEAYERWLRTVEMEELDAADDVLLIPSEVIVNGLYNFVAGVLTETLHPGERGIQALVTMWEEMLRQHVGRDH